MNKKLYIRQFVARRSTRFHMFFILSLTILTGMVLSKVLLWLGVGSMALRYPLVLVLAFLCFFGLVRLWLSYLTQPPAGEPQRKGGGTGSSVADAVFVGSSGSSSSSSPPAAPSVFQGGSSGGGGASGGWEVGDEGTGFAPAALAGSEQAASSSSSGSSAVDASDLVDGDSGLVWLVVIAVAVAVLGSSIFLIIQAPVIISEAAFEFALSAGLLKGIKKMESAGWEGTVFKHTWKPALILFVVVAAVGVGVELYCPQATRLSELGACP